MSLMHGPRQIFAQTPYSSCKYCLPSIWVCRQGLYDRYFVQQAAICSIHVLTERANPD